MTARLFRWQRTFPPQPERDSVAQHEHPSSVQQRPFCSLPHGGTAHWWVNIDHTTSENLTRHLMVGLGKRFASTSIQKSANGRSSVTSDISCNLFGNACVKAYMLGTVRGKIAAMTIRRRVLYLQCGTAVLLHCSIVHLSHPYNVRKK